MPRRAPVRTHEPRLIAVRSNHRQRQSALKWRQRIGAEAPQKRVRLVVAAEQDVLAVVDALARVAINERGRASAEAVARFEDHDAHATPRQANGGAEPGEASADNSYVDSIHKRRAIMAWRGRGTRTRLEKTSYPLRSIRRSVSK